MVKKMLFSILLLVPLVVSAQELHVLAAAGQQLAHGDFQLSATIGETCVTWQIGPANCATEGFQQGAVQAVITERAQKGTAGTTNVYPNPTTGKLFVSTFQPDTRSLSLVLYSSIGALVLQTTTSDEQPILDLGSFAAGRYWLVIRAADNQVIATLPVEKISL